MDVLNEFPLVDEHGKRYREFGADAVSMRRLL